MHLHPDDLATKRLRIVARVALFWGVLLLARLFQLQVLEHADYTRQAQQQQERNVELRAPRGAIFDRNGNPLAMSVMVDSVCINPMLVPDPAFAADMLAKVLHVDERELLGKIAWAIEKKRGFLWVKRKITHEESQRLRSYNFDWLEFRQESTRFYPAGERAAHVLGGVDHEERGNAGVELTLDKDLRGMPGAMRTTADVRQNVFDLKVFSDPLPGHDLALTIDERIQYVAEQELAKAVIDRGASTGSLVVMSPKTGDILAMANYPTYNPNVPPRSKNESEARKNLAVMAPFEPGSVFKVITLAAGLQTTNLTPESLFFCHNGAFTLFRRVIHDAKPHGTLNMAEVLSKSSNIGAIKVGLAVGNQKMYEYIRAFGFGRSTGLPLPGESAGMLRKPERWIASSIGSVAMGHELSTTTVQLAQACSVVANGGMLMKPRLVMRKGDQPVPPASGQRVLTGHNSAKMRAMMRKVVDEGTGKLARLKGYTAGGKTGSAQIYDYAARVYTHRYNGSFMGFAPVSDPAIVIVVTLNNTPSGSRGFGGVVAAPVFQKVATAALRVLGVPKDAPEEVDMPPGKPIPESDLADAEFGEPAELEQPANGQVVLASTGQPQPLENVVYTGPRTPDFGGKTKRTVLAESIELGIRVETEGAGIARRQYPAPGTPLQVGTRVRVKFSR